MRVSSTTLEQFRLYLTADFVSEADLIASIKGEFKPNRKMQLGTAFHSILERPDPYYVIDRHAFVCDGFEFQADDIMPCLEVYDRRGLFELKFTKEYQINGRAVTVVAKVDQVIGRQVNETKSKWSTFNIDHYMESCQWRWYIEIPEASYVTYNVFCFDELKSGITLKSIEQFNLFPYAGLREDCMELLTRFVDFVVPRGLDKYCVKREHRR